MLAELRNELKAAANPKKAKVLQGFFKTGRGQYGEGDIFLGITVPRSRGIAMAYASLPLHDVKGLLRSKIHEERLVGLLILVHRYQKGGDSAKRRIVDFYLENRRRVNNWDLVDLTADKILGHYFFDKDKTMLYRFATSPHLWERRIAIISTFYFIKNNHFDEALKISKMLLNDRQDLIHKAVGWMLREIGKKDQSIEEKFLRQHHKTMPRTMLRYAIERFDGRKKKHYMAR